MAVTEESGLFDTGTFDNAQFDTVNTTSQAGIFSTLTTSFEFLNTSTVNVFSDLGREIQQDLASFTSVFSTVDAQRQILRTPTSFLNAFTQTDFKLGKKITSTVQAFSNSDSTISVFRDISSNVNLFSQIKILPELKVSSNVSVFSKVNVFREFNRTVSSFTSVFTKAFLEITPRDTSISSAVDKAQSKVVDIKKDVSKTLSGDINK